VLNAILSNFQVDIDMIIYIEYGRKNDDGRLLWHKHDTTFCWVIFFSEEGNAELTSHEVSLSHSLFLFLLHQLKREES
jgi:hypothetical protein